MEGRLEYVSPEIKNIVEDQMRAEDEITAVTNYTQWNSHLLDLQNEIGKFNYQHH